MIIVHMQTCVELNFQLPTGCLLALGRNPSALYIESEVYYIGNSHDPHVQCLDNSKVPFFGLVLHLSNLRNRPLIPRIRDFRSLVSIARWCDAEDLDLSVRHV